MSKNLKIIFGITIAFLSLMLCFCLYIDNTMLFFMTFGGVITAIALTYSMRYLYFKSNGWKNVVNEYDLEINDLLNTSNQIIDAQNKLYFYREVNVSQSVLKKASKNPYKYVCKYFDLEVNDNFIVLLDNFYHGFYFIERNINDVNQQKNRLVKKMKSRIPFIIRLVTGNIDDAIGLTNLVKTPLYPEYRFYYKSNGGRSYKKYSVYFNSITCQSFLKSLKEDQEYNVFVKTQRGLMTDKLREYIKERDHYTCQMCGASIYTHPNIQFHIDHIIPVSKGGTTEESNLQTLCSHCNLSKSNKIIERRN